MKAKLPVALSIILILAILFAPAALASGGGNFSNQVDKVNAFIQREINKAVAEADQLLSDYRKQIGRISRIYDAGCITLAEKTNAIHRCNAKFEADLEKIAEKLIEKANRAVDALLKKAEKCFIDIEVEYIQVELAGHAYTVDPLRIIGH